MKKKIRITALICSVLMLLCACGNKLSPLTEAEVKDSLTASGYYDPDYAKEETKFGWEQIGALLTNHWVVSFCDYGKDEGACSDELKLDLLTHETTTVATGSNYEIYEQNGDTLVIISRVGNTILMLSGPSKDETAIRDFARSLGYYK